MHILGYVNVYVLLKFVCMFIEGFNVETVFLIVTKNISQNSTMQSLKFK